MLKVTAGAWDRNGFAPSATFARQRGRATIDRRECELCAGRLALVDRLAVEAHEDLVAGLERRVGLHGDGERIEVHELLLVGRPHHGASLVGAAGTLRG